MLLSSCLVLGRPVPVSTGASSNDIHVDRRRGCPLRRIRICQVPASYHSIHRGDQWQPRAHELTARTANRRRTVAAQPGTGAAIDAAGLAGGRHRGSEIDLRLQIGLWRVSLAWVGGRRRRLGGAVSNHEAWRLPQIETTGQAWPVGGKDGPPRGTASS